MQSKFALSLSYGKDSIACLEAIKILGLPLDRIVHVEVWATDTIPGELPEMIEWKAKAKTIIENRYGVEVEHFYAKRKNRKLTYDRYFYSKRKRGERIGCINGFPMLRTPWCNNRLKIETIDFHTKGCVNYIGIAADEVERLKNKSKKQVMYPLVELGWTEAYCRKWCAENDLLSPIYKHTSRGGCWFCHNQSVGELRHLRHHYPKYWRLMLKWDNDSPFLFTPHYTIHDFDKRFGLEDKGLVPTDKTFRWAMVKEIKEQEVKDNDTKNKTGCIRKR